MIGTISLIIVIFYGVIYACLSITFVKNALHMFQQNHYELKRYSKWLFSKDRIHFSYVLIYIVLVTLIDLLIKSFIGSLLCAAISGGFAIYFIFKEANTTYIKDLVITSRVKRQIGFCAFLMGVLILWSMFNLPAFLVGIITIYGSYLIIYPMALLTYPLEEAVKNRFLNEAKDKLKQYDNLIKIGITGSYGKTSTKNIVSDVISSNLYTLITPASYNTPMGITRTIRQMLKPIHQVFVCEMGADKVKDIEYLMNFVKPKYGVVTSIGPQHLATFKSQENITKEKMKEIEMLPSDGVGFINLDNEFIKEYEIKNTCKIVSVGIDNKKADLVASNIKYSDEGSKFSVKIKNKTYKFETCLLGKHNITNILIAIAIGLELNIDIKEIVKSVKNIKQIEHRLEVKKINGYTFIDDAFNANPVGSKMSLDVLALMKGKRVIVTPGMIDLGSKQDEYNKDFGVYMKDKADYVILVGRKQTKAIMDGLTLVNFDEKKVFVVDNVKEAFELIYNKFSKADTILLENDLPDAFNV